MANAFTETFSRRFGGPNSQHLKMVRGTLVVDTTASGGAAADDLPASLFGLTKLLGCDGIVPDSEDDIYQASPDFTGDSLLVNLNDGGSALDDLPNDTYALTVWGY